MLYITSLFPCTAVNVGYARAAYTFSESIGNGSIVVRASNPVASPFTVRVQGGETGILLPV